jgi:hypothetical protein
VPRCDGTVEARGAVERRVVMDDNDAIARETHIKFDAVCPERKAVIERVERIFWR